MTNTIDKSNKAIATSNLVGLNFSSQEWFVTCTSANGPTGGAWFSDFMVNNEVKQVYNTNGYGMAFAAPIKNDKGEVIGVWYNFASWKEVTQGIRSAAEEELHQTYPQASIIISNNAGDIIDASDEKLINNGFKLDTNITENNFMLNGQNVDFSTHITGWATARGAYIYEGKKWNAATIIPATKLSIATFFSAKILPVILIAILLVGLFGYYFYKKVKSAIIDKINHLKIVLEEFSNGNLPQVNDHMISNDEIGTIAKAVKTVSDNLSRLVIVLTSNVNDNNSNDDIVVFNNQGVLGTSLVNMRTNLKNVAEEDFKRNWATEGMAKFGDILRDNSRGLEILADNILTNLVRYIGANQGGLFVVNDSNKQKRYLELIASYAWEKKKYINLQIEEGEGLVGQAWLEQDMIYLTEVPQDYIKITSGLGNANPSCVIIIPLTINGETYGVIELASFQVYEQYQLEFLKKLAESIASTISNAKVNERTKILLEQSQQQTEEMRAQEEEMRQNMEEMQATSEESERKSQNYESAIQRLNQELQEANNEIMRLKNL
jgi:methyl-accepting chemotaxis protein